MLNGLDDMQLDGIQKEEYDWIGLINSCNTKELKKRLTNIIMCALIKNHKKLQPS